MFQQLQKDSEGQPARGGALDQRNLCPQTVKRLYGIFTGHRAHVVWKARSFRLRSHSGLPPDSQDLSQKECSPRNRQCMDEVASVKMDTESLSQGLIFFIALLKISFKFIFIISVVNRVGEWEKISLHTDVLPSLLRIRCTIFSINSVSCKSFFSSKISFTLSVPGSDLSHCLRYKSLFVFKLVRIPNTLFH